MDYVCTVCGKRFPANTLRPNCGCGGLLELDFTPPAWSEDRIHKDTWSLFRYRDFLALDGDTWKSVTMGEGMTPVIPFEENGDVLLKMDYMMPTLSFKDRGAVTLVSHMKAIGVKKCVQDSSGNAGNSVAAYCARAGIECEIFVNTTTSPKKKTMIRAHGAVCTEVEGSRDHCADVCRSKVFNDGLYYANHVYNPFFYEGMKTYIYEILEQLGRIPANIVVPVGNGTLYIGVIKALEHLQASGVIKNFPNIIALQSELCDPLFQAAKKGLKEPAIVEISPTLAEGIAIGIPMRGRELLEMAAKHNVKFVRAPENEILEARSVLAKRGLYVEHTTAANLAAYWAWCRENGPTPDTVITMCGAGIKSDH